MDEEESTDPTITEFFFVRHAPVIKNAGALPAFDPPISEGPYPVEALCKTLPKQADWLISPRKRSRQTAALFRNILCPASEILDKALTEQDFGLWHNKEIDAVWEQVKHGPRHNWSFLMPEVIPPRGESFDAQISRVALWCKAIELRNYKRPQIVFTHAGTIRAVMAHLLGLSSNRAQSLVIPNFGCLHAHLMDAAHAEQHHGGAWQLQSLRPLMPDTL